MVKFMLSQRVFLLFMLTLMFALAFTLPSAVSQQSCQSGVYTLAGNLKVNGNIESTGTIKGANVQGSSSSGSQSDCVELTPPPSAGDYPSAAPNCLISGVGCTFIVEATWVAGGGSKVYGITEITKLPTNLWLNDEPSYRYEYGYNGPVNSYLVKRTLSGTLGNGKSETILTGLFGRTYETFGTACVIADDYGGDPNTLKVTLASGSGCSCRMWACPK